MNLIQADQRRRAPLENVDDPAQRDDGPGQLHHVNAECREVPTVMEPESKLSGDTLSSQISKPAPARVSPWMTSRPPIHSTSTIASPSISSSVGQSMPISRTSFRLRRNVFLIFRLEGDDLRFFLHIGADQRAPEKFSCARAEMSENMA
jgi:hypothetical protein